MGSRRVFTGTALAAPGRPWRQRAGIYGYGDLGQDPWRWGARPGSMAMGSRRVFTVTALAAPLQGGGRVWEGSAVPEAEAEEGIDLCVVW